jgi:hypothetical protein
MPCILLDASELNKDNRLYLLTKLDNKPKEFKGFTLGIVCILEQNIFNQLIGLNIKNRKEYLYSSTFTILDSFFVMYNSKKEICVLPVSNYIQEFVDMIEDSRLHNDSLNSNTTLWIGLDLKSKELQKQCNICAQNGFGYPYITMVNPLFSDIPVSIALSRTVEKKSFSAQSILNSIADTLKQYKSNSNVCYIYAKFSNDALAFLRHLAKDGGKNDKGKQMEVTGELGIKDIIRENNNFVYIIDVNKNSVHSGQEEDVNVSAVRYNFHSHPHEAYVRHSVDKAWPSSTDYIGYLKLGISTIFHCVSTLEGLYIMSFSPYWGNRLKEVNVSFVESKYDISHHEKYTPNQYVDKVNSILYKAHPIYNVQFYSWNKAQTTFKVFFPQINSVCMNSQKSIENKKLIS